MRLILLVLFLGIMGTVISQNIGIGSTSPVSALHIADSTRDILTIENLNSLDNNVQAGINFAAGIGTNNLYRYIGAIRAIGTGTNVARMGFFTYASSLPIGLTERLTILDNGHVGIGITNPLYTFSVNGDAYIGTYLGVQATPGPPYSLAVGNAVRFYGSLQVDGVVTLASLGVTGNMTVENGYGIVRNVSSTQMKIKRQSASFSYSGLAAGGTVDSGYLYFGEDFSSVSVSVGDVTTGTGDWAKVLLVPFNVDTSSDRCQFKITNTSTAAITFTGTWEVVEVGN